MNQSNTNISDALKDAGLEILTCMQCGTCSGSCPSGRYTGMITRKLVRKARMSTDVLHDPNLRMCTTCYTCQERCQRIISRALGSASRRQHLTQKHDPQYPDLNHDGVVTLADAAIVLEMAARGGWSGGGRTLMAMMWSRPSMR
ncbi:MAG: 4Fe-4S dicluster domain-containing protein [Euryarchaeota archaeon]|nr:4Fe-4S dicluster domain-containing protein [Euryarchaeota archaeon]